MSFSSLPRPEAAVTSVSHCGEQEKALLLFPDMAVGLAKP